jgi:hypothetical protein
MILKTCSNYLLFVLSLIALLIYFPIRVLIGLVFTILLFQATK